MELNELRQLREMLQDMEWVPEPRMTDSGEMVTYWRPPGSTPGTGMPEESVTTMLECQLLA